MTSNSAIVPDIPFEDFDPLDAGEAWDEHQAKLKLGHSMNEEEKLSCLSDIELVSYWNILQAGKRMLQLHVGDRSHEVIVERLLTKRNIPHESGKRIKIGT